MIIFCIRRIRAAERQARQNLSGFVQFYDRRHVSETFLSFVSEYCYVSQKYNAIPGIVNSGKRSGGDNNRSNRLKYLHNTVLFS